LGVNEKDGEASRELRLGWGEENIFGILRLIARKFELSSAKTLNLFRFTEAGESFGGGREIKTGAERAQKKILGKIKEDVARAHKITADQ